MDLEWNVLISNWNNASIMNYNIFKKDILGDIKAENPKNFEELKDVIDK